MQFSFLHNCVTVKDLDRSIDFYKQALGLIPKRRLGGDELTLVYMGDAASSHHELELAWKASHKDKDYQLGENAAHLAFEVDDYEGALAMHQSMGCVVEVNEKDSVYFIADPDGYIIELLPRNHFSQTEGVIK